MSQDTFVKGSQECARKRIRSLNSVETYINAFLLYKFYIKCILILLATVFS